MQEQTRCVLTCKLNDAMRILYLSVAIYVEVVTINVSFFIITIKLIDDGNLTSKSQYSHIFPVFILHV